MADESCEKLEGFKWSKNSTMLLISLIKEKYDQLQTGVKKWEFKEIAKEINNQTGSDLNYEQIDTKWKGLKRTYNKIKNSNTKKGQRRKFWEFYNDVDEILQNAAENNTLVIYSTEDMSASNYENEELDVVDDTEVATYSTSQNEKRLDSGHEDDEAESYLKFEIADKGCENKFEGFKWSKGATLLLISLIKSKENQLQTGVKKAVFIEIAKEINHQTGANLNYEQVDTKWKGLKRTYNKFKNSNTRKGQRKKNWEFYNDVDEILQNTPENNTLDIYSNEDISASNYETELDGVDYTEVATYSTSHNGKRLDSGHEDDEAESYLKFEIADKGCENKFEGFKWSKGATLLLISLIKENENQLQTGVKKSVFTEIAKQINKKTGANLTYEQVDTKWKGLKRTYNKIRNSNTDIEKAKKLWEFYNDVDIVLHNAVEVNPPATLSTDDFSESSYEIVLDDVDYTEVAACSTSQKRKRSYSDREDSETARERRHQKRMADAKRFFKSEMADRSDENKIEGFKWSRSATLLLISLIKEKHEQLETGVKKFVFQEIANEINKKTGANLTYVQIDSKWKGLKRTYNKIHDSNADTGQERIFWEFYNDVDDVLHHTAEVNPLANLSNDEISASSETDFEGVDYNEVTTYAPAKNQKQRCTGREDSEAAKERRHQERMGVAKKFLTLFEKMVNKM